MKCACLCVLIISSLQATWIRNTILRAIRESSSSVSSQLPMDAVFKAPTISALTYIVLRVVHGSPESPPYTTSTQNLEEMVEHYISGLGTRPQQLRPRTITRDVVLVTGTTGGFGCDILEHLLRDDKVDTVYAFNRVGAKPMERQLAQFRKRGHDEALLASPSFKMVEVDLHAPNFNIESSLLAEVGIRSLPPRN